MPGHRTAAADAGTARPSDVPDRAGHAVVVGAGPAGVTAALRLAVRFERVTLLDRADVPGPEWDAVPRPPGVRAALASPRVVVRAGLEVVGLVMATTITGVVVRRRRDGPAAGLTEIAADLVVDARGGVAVPARADRLELRGTREGRGHDGPRPSAGLDARARSARGAS